LNVFETYGMDKWKGFESAGSGDARGYSYAVCKGEYWMPAKD